MMSHTLAEGLGVRAPSEREQTNDLALFSPFFLRAAEPLQEIHSPLTDCPFQSNTDLKSKEE